MKEKSLNNNPSPQIKTELESDLHVDGLEPAIENDPERVSEAESDAEAPKSESPDVLPELTKEERLMIFCNQRAMKIALIRSLHELNEESARRIELHNECLRTLPKKLSPTHTEMSRPVKCN